MAGPGRPDPSPWPTTRDRGTAASTAEGGRLDDGERARVSMVDHFLERPTSQRRPSSQVCCYAVEACATRSSTVPMASRSTTGVTILPSEMVSERACSKRRAVEVSVETSHNNLDLSALLAALPPSPAQFAVTGARVDVTMPSTSADSFVAPRLMMTGVVDALAAFQVIVISAAGAVGKSTLARELAARQGIPLWDLATSGSIGQGSLQGMITQAFGVENVSGIHKAISSGRFGLVIDALDEGRIRVSEVAFEDFLKDIGDIAKSLTRPALVLLGRTQIARTAWWHLDDAGVRVALLEIGHFDRQQRIEYIEKKVRHLNPSAANAAETHAGPFAAVRDKIFALLSHAVTGGHSDERAVQADLFLGYSPVLDAVSVLLANEKNFVTLQREIERLDSGTISATRGPIATLRRVVETIMKREQEQKLIPNMKQAIEAIASKHAWTRWGDLYSISEQSARLLGIYLNSPDSVKRSTDIPAEIQAAYEERLQPWLDEHPFLRDGAQVGNAVFESFLIAQALVNDVGGMRRPVEATLRDARHKPNPLMAEFYFDLLADNAMHVEHLGFVYDSLLSGLRESSRILFSFEGGDVSDNELEGTAEAEFEFLDENGDELRPAIKRRVPVDFTSQLVFTRYLKDASIETGIDVVLGGGANEYELGPRVSIECRALHIDAASLVVTGSRSDTEPEDFGVVLSSQKCESKVTAQPRVRSKLHVTWPGAEGFPWVRYATRPVQPLPAVGDAFARFRRIVMTLRSHKKGSLARVKDKVESQHILGDGIGPHVLDRLKKDGLLRLDGRFYHWVPDRADALVGISWLQLRNNESSDKLWNYLLSIS